MAHPAGIVPIIGSQQPDRITEALASLNITLTRPQWYQILVAARGEPMP